MGASTWAPLGVCALLLTSANALSSRVRPVVESGPVAMTSAQRERLEGAAQMSLFGQFRASMSDFLWLKVDKYVHNGVDLRALTEEERRSGRFGKVRTAHGDANAVGVHRGDETTVVVAREFDWRGRLGDVERAVRPYRSMDGHEHRDPDEALPLFRLMTVANPRFVDGYVTGAYVLSRDRARLSEARAFLEEGAKKNPESIQIHAALGGLLTRRLRRWDEAVPSLTRALELAAARDRQTLSEDERDAWQDAFRCLATNRLEAGDRAAARAVAEAGLRLFPDDPSCQAVLRRLREPEPKAGATRR